MRLLGLGVALVCLAGAARGRPQSCTCPPPSRGSSPVLPGHGDGVYLGNGCFWHTQYDLYTVEMAPPFNRSTSTATARAGYGGSVGNGTDQHMVCYITGPDWTTPCPPGTYYGYPGLAYAEAAQVVLDKDAKLAAAQFAALVVKYFESYQLDPDGKTWDRLDPNDAGRDYRSIVGIPGGVKGPLFAVLAAHNKHNMTLTQGHGGEVTDSADEGIVYVYDTLLFPFYRAQNFHQYHTNDVLGRPLPPSYTSTARNAAVSRKWINPTCAEATESGSNVEDIRVMDCACPAH